LYIVAGRHRFRADWLSRRSAEALRREAEPPAPRATMINEWRKAMPVPVSLMALGATLVMFAADRVPTFDVKASCSSVAKLGLSVSQSPDACIKDEEEARAQLKEKWDSYPVADRNRCVATTEIGGTPSYVEIITCLQIAQDVKKLKEPVQ
jgi:hypothetical protein